MVKPDYCSSLGSLPGYFLEESYSQCEKAFQSLSASYTNAKDSICDYYSKIPSIIFTERKTLNWSNLCIFLGSFTIGGTLGGLCDFQSDPLLWNSDFLWLKSTAIAGAKCVGFSILLSLVNAVVRPLFIQYFPKDWGFSQLVLETLVTVTIASTACYFALPLIGLTSTQLTQMAVISALGRLFSGYEYNFEAQTHIFESKQTSYQTTVTGWFVAYTPFIFG